MSKDDQKVPQQKSLVKEPQNCTLKTFVNLLKASQLQMACPGFNRETNSLPLQLEHFMLYSPCNVGPMVSCSLPPCSELETK